METGGRGVIALPTGGGKTRIAQAAAARSSARLLVLVPTRILLDQRVRDIRQHYDGPLGIFGDGTRELQAIPVAILESPYRLMRATGRQLELLVIDEVHHFGAGVRDEALEICAASARLDVTAPNPIRATQRPRPGGLRKIRRPPTAYHHKRSPPTGARHS